MRDSNSSDIVRGDRFSGGPARGFLSSLAEDERIFEADLAVDRAHVIMLAEQGIITQEVAASILDALGEIERAGFDALPAGEDVHAAIETAVVDASGDAGRQMHTARSRNDEVATCIRFRLAEDLLDLIEATLGLRETILSVAGDHIESVMPGYTHLQPAQPTTIAHWLLSYESALTRDVQRMFDLYDRVNQSPLGAAAFAGTAFPIDRERTATLLGFDGVILNAMDAVASRDFSVETTATVAGLATNLSGAATDMIQFSSQDFIELDTDYASTSSIMPQKRNPDSLELVRATSGDAAAALNGVLTTLKGLPRAYNRDLQRGTPHLWLSIDTVLQSVDVVSGAVATATWHAETLETAATSGFATATGIAEHLAMHGVPFRTAHEIVATAADEGGDLRAIEAAVESALDEPLEAIVDLADIESILEAVPNVGMRDSQGGPAPTAVEPAIAEASDGLADSCEKLQSARDDRHAADVLRAQEVAKYR
jgi:argininosuccinate lyase